MLRCAHAAVASSPHKTKDVQTRRVQSLATVALRRLIILKPREVWHSSFSRSNSPLCLATSYTRKAQCSFPMPPITALLHTANDALRLGRALETLLPCAEILIVDHHSADATRHIARQYGARIVVAEDKVSPQRYLHLATFEWILSLQPSESITEGLQASLFEWSALPAPSTVTHAGMLAFSVFVREETGENWLRLP